MIRMKKIVGCLLFAILLSTNLTFASHDPTARGARSLALGGSSVAINDFWSVFNNSACNAFTRKITVGAYFENRYLLKELSYRGLGVIIPTTEKDAFGLNVQQFGYSQYMESKVGLSYSKKFSESFAAGLQFDYLNTKVGEGIGSKNLFTFEIGLYSKLNKQLSLGFTAFNPARTKFSDYNDYNEYVPIVLKLGARYDFSDNLFVISEIEKDILNDPILRLGIDYKLSEMFFVRGGISTGVVAYSFGMGMHVKNFSFDIATSVHQVLGASPQVSLQYTF